jgi:hypothetical protein
MDWTDDLAKVLDDNRELPDDQLMAAAEDVLLAHGRRLTGGKLVREPFCLEGVVVPDEG